MKYLTRSGLLSLFFCFQSLWGALPLPPAAIPEQPPFDPMVITSGGQKLLLAQAEVRVRWDRETRQLVSSHPGWWLINYPLDRIEGLEDQSPDRISEVIFGRPAAEVRNWYLRTPPVSGMPLPDEPSAPDGPAPIVPHPEPSLVVDQRHPSAHDQNPGTGESPLKTVQAAVERAQPGDVIQVRPGTYREAVRVTRAGTADRRIVIEGVRDEEGRMPVLSGNDLAPAGAWSEVPGQAGLWRAERWTRGPAEMARAGSILRERTVLEELEEWEFIQSRGDRELLAPRLGPGSDPRPGDTALGREWRKIPTNDNGFIEFGEERGLFYASSWVWLDPVGGEVWDPRFPAPITGQIWMGGGFRAGHFDAGRWNQQMNPYRVWINGELMPTAGQAGEPRAATRQTRDYDIWSRMPFREGWNHVFMLFDSTFREDAPHTYRFRLPRGRPETVSSPVRPDDLTKPVEGEKYDWLNEWMLLGPLPAENPDRFIYLRVPEGIDPNGEEIDMGERQHVVFIDQPYWTVRGLEIRHGAQAFQRAQFHTQVPGVTIEYCKFVEPQVRALTFYLRGPGFEDHDATPVVIRGNWIESPGSLGMGTTASTTHLTEDNLLSPPMRGRLLVEHNTIINNNRGGEERFDESGAMKFFRLTNSVVRHNTIIEGDGPAIWYDWEHYNNRIEGNLALRPTAFAVGVEASPGPNLVANNVSIDLRPGGSYFRYGILAWSSSRTWVLHNTIDNALEDPAGGGGIYLGEGGNNRGTHWDPLTHRESAVINNLVVRTETPLDPRRAFPVEGNLFIGGRITGTWDDRAYGQQVMRGPQLRRASELPDFANPARGDYRTPPGGVVAGAGVAEANVPDLEGEVEVVGLVRHDFFGLLRHPGEPRAAGAFRLDQPPADERRTQLEVEFNNGEMKRFWRPVGD